MASRITPTLSAPTSEATTDRRQDILNAALACAAALEGAEPDNAPVSASPAANAADGSTATGADDGMAPWPRGAACTTAPRGQGAMPLTVRSSEGLGLT